MYKQCSYYWNAIIARKTTTYRIGFKSFYLYAKRICISVSTLLLLLFFSVFPYQLRIRPNDKKKLKETHQNIINFIVIFSLKLRHLLGKYEIEVQQKRNIENKCIGTSVQWCISLLHQTRTHTHSLTLLYSIFYIVFKHF